MTNHLDGSRTRSTVRRLATLVAAVVALVIAAVPAAAQASSLSGEYYNCTLGGILVPDGGFWDGANSGSFWGDYSCDSSTSISYDNGSVSSNDGGYVSGVYNCPTIDPLHGGNEGCLANPSWNGNGNLYMSGASSPALNFDIEMTHAAGPWGAGTISITNANDTDGDFSGGTGTGAYVVELCTSFCDGAGEGLYVNGHFTIIPSTKT